MNIFSEINYFTFSLLLGGVIALVSGVSVYIKGERGGQNLAWLLLNVSTAVWSFGYFSMVVSVSERFALLSNWVLHFGAIFIPFFYFSFITHITGTYQRYKKYLYVGSIFLVSFFILNTTSLLVKGVLPKYTFNFAPDAGPLYIYFTLYFFLFVILAIFVLLLKIPKTSGEESSRLKYILWSSVAGFLGGGSVFFLTFNINIPPYPLIMFSLYPMIIAYAILKYHLFSLKLILVELAILLLNMLLLFNVFTSRGQADAILNIFISSLVFLFSIFLMRGIYKDIRDRERIESLAYEMAVINEKLKIMEEQKTEFVSIASHQLRTPLTVIKGYASMILERTFGELSAEVQDAMDKLYSSSERIVALVDDLLTVSRLEQGRMPLTFESVELGAFMQGVVDETEARTTEAGLDISLNTENDTEFWSSIDEKKFKQVVKHMLDNAIKYTTSPGSIYVTLSEDLVAQKNRIAISDTGEGMTSEQIRAVFERFNLKVKEPLGSDESNMDVDRENVIASEEKADNEKTENEKDEEMLEKKTPGIGLYIAQEIIHAHNGILRVESAGKDRGTTFIVEIPREAKKDTENR